MLRCAFDEELNDEEDRVNALAAADNDDDELLDWLFITTEESFECLLRQPLDVLPELLAC